MADVLDEVLDQFAKRGPEFGPGLSNHGPMAAEALVALGREDAVTTWSEWYVAKLDSPMDARNPIARDEWREALGDMRRAGDWSVYFARELDELPWQKALDVWVARLAPGIMAGATHGILRTAHAVRSLGRGETAHRRRELAEGLAYWAARYQELPSSAGARPPVPGGVEEALAGVELVDEKLPRRGLIFDVVKNVETTNFAPVIGRVDVGVDVDAFVGDVTRTFVRGYLAHADTAAIAFVHTVTAPSSLRHLAPYLSDATMRAAMRYAWQACASIWAAYGRRDARESQMEGEQSRDDLIERAVKARDEHAIKFTEACLREHALSGDAAFLVAANDAVRRLRVG